MMVWQQAVDVMMKVMMTMMSGMAGNVFGLSFTSISV